MRLQDTYKLNTSQIANGEISTNFKSRKLTGKNRTGLIHVDWWWSLCIALECFDLGRVAYTNSDYYHTLMWMQEALEHLNTETNNTALSKLHVLDHLAFATSKVRSFPSMNIFIPVGRLSSKEISSMHWPLPRKCWQSVGSVVCSDERCSIEACDLIFRSWS